ncbi:MAG: hypothetical protein ABFD49_01500 [Armatimonadota bacterium]|nr:hypothetical protein [bacterium]
MAVAAVRRKTDTAGTTRLSPRALRARSRRLRFARFKHGLKMLLPVIAVVMLFGWVAVYANVTVTGYNRARLTAECRAAKLMNERLKVEYNRLSSPHKVVAAAEKTGMVYATDYDYVHPPQTVASAKSTDD